jgi:hypothetical protein
VKVSNSRRYWVAAGMFLAFLFSAIFGRSQSSSAGMVQVEMNPQKPLSLRVTLHSRAQTPVTLYRDRLPWGLRYSMILVGVTPKGDHLENELPIDDPTTFRISVEPEGTLTGEIDLTRRFRDLDSAVKKSDILLFWAYDAPAELHIGRWSGGWILIPQQK